MASAMASGRSNGISWVAFSTLTRLPGGRARRELALEVPPDLDHGRAKGRLEALGDRRSYRAAASTTSGLSPNPSVLSACGGAVAESETLRVWVGSFSKVSGLSSRAA